MSLSITLDDVVNHPRILMVMEDATQALEHAQNYCDLYGYQLDRRKMKIKIDGEDSSLIVRWTWPDEEMELYTDKTNKWVCKFGGIELTQIVLHTCIPPRDMCYLISRLRSAKG
ncbi:hypothetical protein D3C80_1430060 [compost metagenome]